MLGIAVEYNVTNTSYVLLRQSLKMEGQLLLLLCRHRQRIIELTTSCRHLLLLLLLFWRSRDELRESLVLGRFGLPWDSVVVFLELHGDFDEIFSSWVEGVTVIEYFNHIFVELNWILIFPSFELRLNCWKVHRLLYNLSVLRNIQSFNIHWLKEGPSTLVLLELLKNFHTGL